jgi:hypothetical protein
MGRSSFPVPFPHVYWVGPWNLLVGGYPGNKIRMLSYFLMSRFSLIIDLVDYGEFDQSGIRLNRYYSELYKKAKALGIRINISRKPIRHLDVPSPQLMKAVLDRIDMALDRDRRVYIHSWNGRGRTGTVVGCWMVRHGMTGENALKEIKNLRWAELKDDQPSPETEAQRKMILSWKG